MEIEMTSNDLNIEKENKMADYTITSMTMNHTHSISQPYSHWVAVGPPGPQGPMGLSGASAETIEKMQEEILLLRKQVSILCKKLKDLPELVGTI